MVGAEPPYSAVRQVGLGSPLSFPHFKQRVFPSKTRHPKTSIRGKISTWGGKNRKKPQTSCLLQSTPCMIATLMPLKLVANPFTCKGLRGLGRDHPTDSEKNCTSLVMFLSFLADQLLHSWLNNGALTCHKSFPN